MRKWLLVMMAFTNGYEWLCFTLDELIKKNFHVIVKGHPNFWSVGFAEYITKWEPKIWKKLSKI